MNAVRCYELWYSAGVPQHYLKSFRGNGVANKFNMAEYALELMNYEKPRSAIASHLENMAIANYRSGTRQPIEFLHNHFKDEIRSNYQARQLTQEEFEQALLDEYLRGELEKINAEFEATIVL